MNKKLLLILVIGLFLRLYGINWDQGFHLHPDERMIIMVADQIRFFKNLNPNFFNYGSLPIYLLKGIAQLLDYFLLTNFASYNGLLYLGRFLSVIFDTTTIFLIYKLAVTLFKDKKIAILSAFFYAIAFFPIQNSHFFVVDVFLILLITLLIYLLLQINPSILLVGIVLGAMIATKFTAIIFLPIVLLMIGFRFRSPLYVLCLIFIIVLFFFIFMPYGLINQHQYLNNISHQLKMNSNPYVFPYTLQYVNTLPYLYYLKNMFLWGFGPIISTLSLIGMISVVKKSKLNDILILICPSYAGLSRPKSGSKQLRGVYTRANSFASGISIIFYLIYFIVIGRSSVKFMRYMLPVYPFLAVMAGYGFYQIINLKLKIKNLLTIAIITGSVIWTLMFVNIYTQKHTRVAATEWILKNIPYGSTLAIEHWDDRLPLTGSENYKLVEMTLYNLPDDESKWSDLKSKLKQTDYIIIASNRLYVPLQKLSDCSKYPVCYPKTAQYYKDLFNNKLGFKKVAEFSVFPKLEIGSANWRMKLEIKDENADESFTVYDHPKIMIFKKSH